RFRNGSPHRIFEGAKDMVFPSSQSRITSRHTSLPQTIDPVWVFLEPDNLEPVTARREPATGDAPATARPLGGRFHYNNPQTCMALWRMRHSRGLIRSRAPSGGR